MDAKLLLLTSKGCECMFSRLGLFPTSIISHLGDSKDLFRFFVLLKETKRYLYSNNEGWIVLLEVLLILFGRSSTTNWYTSISRSFADWIRQWIWAWCWNECRQYGGAGRLVLIEIPHQRYGVGRRKCVGGIGLPVTDEFPSKYRNNDSMLGMWQHISWSPKQYWSYWHWRCYFNG